MARKRKKKKKKRTQLDPYEVLEGKVPVTALELIRLIHRVNPTNTEVDVNKASERYRVKVRLQSLLIRKFKESLHVEIPDPQNPRCAKFFSHKIKWMNDGGESAWWHEICVNHS